MRARKERVIIPPLHPHTRNALDLSSILAKVKAIAADHLPKDDFGIKVDGGGIRFWLIRRDRLHPSPDLPVP